MKKTACFLLFLVLFVPVGASRAKDFSVSSSDQLRDALKEAAQNKEADTITILAGTYFVANELRYYPLRTPNPDDEERHPVTINGAGKGSTILDGQMKTRILAMYTMELRNDQGAEITISGITFRNGSRDDGAGALFVATKQPSVQITACEFRNNKAHSSHVGGALVSTDTGDITLSQTSFINNYAGGGTGGCGAWSRTGAVTVMQCTFTGNKAENSQGGGLEVGTTSGSVTLNGNTFKGNLSRDKGGGAFAFGLYDFAAKKAGTVQVVANKFINNTYGGLGGGLAAECNNGSIAIEDNTFSGNKGEGGGTYTWNVGGSVVLAGNVYDGNGSGVRAVVQGGSLLMVNNTLKGHTDRGVAIEIKRDDGEVSVENNIIWSPASRVPDLYIDGDADDNGRGGTARVFNNDFQRLSRRGLALFSRGRNISGNPRLTTSLHIQEDSPCIDAGRNSALGMPAKDFEGDPRKADGNGDRLKVVDIGADEYVPVTVLRPNGGEVLTSGSTFRITWTAAPRARKYRIDYSTDNGLTWGLVKNGLTVKRYDWKVPPIVVSSPRCRVWVTAFDGNGVKIGSDKSDRVFTISP